MRVTGAVDAEVTQICVVSLEPFAATIDEPVEVRFAPAAEASAARRGGESGDEASFDLDGEDEPDPIVEGRIDLGALAAEFLALGLDPYPRKPGVEFGRPRPRAPTLRRSPRWQPSRRRSAEGQPSRRPPPRQCAPAWRAPLSTRGDESRYCILAATYCRGERRPRAAGREPSGQKTE